MVFKIKYTNSESGISRLSFNTYKEKDLALADISLLKELSQNEKTRSRFQRYENLIMEVVELRGKK